MLKRHSMNATEHMYKTVIKLANTYMAERGISNGKDKDDKHDESPNSRYGTVKQTDRIN